jgi:stage V sporulation protein SpoVS
MRRTTTPQPQPKREAHSIRRTPRSQTAPKQPQRETPRLRVGSETDVKKLAGAIAGFAREGYRCMQVRVIGAGADWQLDKAIATAGPWLASTKIKLLLTVSWVDLKVEGLERSGLEKQIYCLPMTPPRS